MIDENRTRSAIKSVMWRLIATANSYVILSAALSDDNLSNAIYMNISGLIVYFGYERVWNKIQFGRSVK